MEDALAPAAVTPAAASPSLSHKCTVHPYLGSVVQFRVLSGLVRCCFLSLCACDRFGLSPAGSTGGLGKLGGVRCETRSQVATSFARAARRLFPKTDLTSVPPAVAFSTPPHTWPGPGPATSARPVTLSTPPPHAGEVSLTHAARRSGRQERA